MIAQRRKINRMHGENTLSVQLCSPDKSCPQYRGGVCHSDATPLLRVFLGCLKNVWKGLMKWINHFEETARGGILWDYHGTDRNLLMCFRHVSLNRRLQILYPFFCRHRWASFFEMNQASYICQGSTHRGIWIWVVENKNDCTRNPYQLIKLAKRMLCLVCFCTIIIQLFLLHSSAIPPFFFTSVAISLVSKLLSLFNAATPIFFM